MLWPGSILIRNMIKSTFGQKRQMKTQIRLRIRADWSESSLGVLLIAKGERIFRYTAKIGIQLFKNSAGIQGFCRYSRILQVFQISLGAPLKGHFLMVATHSKTIYETPHDYDHKHCSNI